ncbi:unnamed protein product [Clavelina lepadiformis]|uniref:NEDD8 ultimate buster 1 n=1 Tax=Clavelina lepadiformis TaxID=159417 RepID=A0ABP0GUB8_CLALP
MVENFNEAVVAKLRVELRQNDVKLWKEPYTKPDGTESDTVQFLAIQYSEKFKLPLEQVLLGLQHLRIFALERLRENERFKTEKIATLKIKFPPNMPTELKFKTIEVDLTISGRQFLERLAQKLSTLQNLLKVIYNGKILDCDSSLASQGITHNKTVMCMVFSADNHEKTKEMESQIKEVQNAKHGAELLASSSHTHAHNYDMHITDQDGKSIDLPKAERSSLMVALALHEKGRAVMKEKKYQFALLFLLEADKQFRHCQSEILNMVDNFAVLCLDICWCYMCLQNVDALPSAAERLTVCEESFMRSYGKSLQRLLAIKGSSGHEVALFVRLYLLQGVVAYHEGNFSVSRDLFAKAKSFADSIQVDEDKVTEMIKLGFSASESRLALRACHGDITAASSQAFQKRDEKERIRKDEKEKSRKRKLAHTLGVCVNGDDINVDLYEQMMNVLGFTKRQALEALKQSNNSLNEAIEYIQKNPKLLADNKKVTRKLIQQVAAMGFDELSAEAALTHFNGFCDQSIAYLASNGGLVPQEWLQAVQSSSTLVSEKPSTSRGSAATKLTTEDKTAMNRLADVVKNEGNYLDITLDEENEYISTYLAKVYSIIH